MEKNKKDKKGFVYTLFVIVFLSALLLFIAIQSRGEKSTLEAEKMRSDDIVYFVRGAEDDMGRSMLIAGRKALVAATADEISGGEFISDANETIAAYMINGSAGLTEDPIMEDSTVKDWASSLNGIGSEKRMDVNIDIKSVKISTASAFGINAEGNITLYAYDPLTKTRYNKTALLEKEISIAYLEDTYILLKSNGTYSNQFTACGNIRGGSYGNEWLYARSYISSASNFSNVSGKADLVLITDTLANKTGYGGFKAIVTENASDVPVSQDYLFGADSAASAAKDNAYVVLSKNTLWITNNTACYFESPSGPSFLDRLEGRGALSSKYNISISGSYAGLGSFAYFQSDYVLDYEHYG